MKYDDNVPFEDPNDGEEWKKENNTSDKGTAADGIPPLSDADLPSLIEPLLPIDQTDADDDIGDGDPEPSEGNPEDDSTEEDDHEDDTCTTAYLLNMLGCSDTECLAMESAVLEAHDYAVAHMPPEDIAACRINFRDYLVAYTYALWRELPPVGLERRLFYIAAPPISRDIDTSAQIECLYKRHKVTPPEGIYDLPMWWGPALVAEMSEASDEALWRMTFGWRKVGITEEGYLDLNYPFQLPMSGDLWPKVCDRLIRLHVRFDPGPFSARARFREFTVT
jgi:hypothetical protein